MSDARQTKAPSRMRHDQDEPTERMASRILAPAKRIYEQTGIKPTRAVVSAEDAKGSWFERAEVEMGGITVIAVSFCPSGSIMLDVEQGHPMPRTGALQ